MAWGFYLSSGWDSLISAQASLFLLFLCFSFSCREPANLSTQQWAYTAKASTSWNQLLV